MLEKVKGQVESWENGQLLSGWGFVQRIASPSLFRDRRIKMQQSINYNKAFEKEEKNILLQHQIKRVV